MSQANVVTSAANVLWYSDKVEIVTGGTAVSYQVYALSTGPGSNSGNIYSANPQVAANSRQQIYVGAGNHLTINGTGFTAREIGTQSSAQYGVISK